MPSSRKFLAADPAYILHLTAQIVFSAIGIASTVIANWMKRATCYGLNTSWVKAADFKYVPSVEYQPTRFCPT